MAPVKRSSLPRDDPGSSRPPKKTKSTICLSESTTDHSMLELEAMNRKLEETVQKIEELQTEVNELKEKLNILENPTATNQTRSEKVVHGRYELKIEGAIKKRVYTGSNVEGENGELLKVAIYYDGDKITSGPLASAKFEILVIKGDFCVSNHRNWNAETFQRNLAKARREVGSILKDAYMSELANGEAIIDGLIFIDNSGWVEGKKWKLGIRLLDTYGERVFEAISNCFRVLDRHGKASEKPHPPLLTYGVECLEKVGKKRALDLKNKKICTVKDFLQLFHRKPSCALKILGINSKYDESWKTMIRHAKECDVGSNLYSYRKNNSLLFFNSVCELVGAEFGNHYRSYDKLSNSKKKLVDKWKKGFYKNIKLRNLTNITADFEIVNGQPVPIEHDFTGISTDDSAPQDDQTADIQDQQPVDAYKSSYDSDAQLPDAETDAAQNPSPDHNTAEHNNLIRAGVQERPPFGFNMIFTSLDDTLLGTRTDADRNTSPWECRFGSMLHSPLQYPSDTEEEIQTWMNTLAAKKAFLQLRGCTAVLLLFNHVRRQRLVG